MIAMPVKPPYLKRNTGNVQQIEKQVPQRTQQGKEMQGIEIE
jgi:hypothetical protein